MSTDRDRLIAALECSDIDLRIAQIADALLPVVDRIANERAAAELEAAADDLVAGGGHLPYARWLRERAAALREPTS